MKLNNWTKIIISVFCFAVAIIGFMIKLPSGFRHYDKELHSLFYFLAAAFLNILFARKNIFYHILIFISLYLFGTAIEYAQEYSNKVFHNRIHGRFDIEDVQANLKGLIIFSVCWIIYALLSMLFFSKKSKDTDSSSGL